MNNAKIKEVATNIVNSIFAETMIEFEPFINVVDRLKKKGWHDHIDEMISNVENAIKNNLPSMVRTPE